MENIHFETSTLIGYGVSGAIMVLLPVVLLIIWKKKTHAPLMPAIVGAVTFAVFALGLEQIPAYLLLMTDTKFAHTISNSLWLTYVIGGLLAGIFEETGRFIAYKFILKKYTGKEIAISYGIGHGGFESIFIGISMASYVIMGIIVNSGNISLITAGLNGDQLIAALSQIRAVSGQSFGASMIGVMERISTITFHIAMSVIVFRSVQSRKHIALFPLAIFLHALTDFSIVFYARGFVSVMVFECLLLVLSAVIFFFTYKLIYCKLEAM